MADTNKKSSKSGQVLLFGCFDPLHAGHLDFFQQAKSLGERLVVVVAPDEYIRQVKNREPQVSEQVRLKRVQSCALVNKAILGDFVSTPANRYQLLGSLDFNIIALGYDQKPADEVVRQELDQRGKKNVQVVRLKPYKPEEYKSSIKK